MVFLAATNCLQLIDPALLRRFDRILEIPLPDTDTRHAMVLHSLQGARHSLTSEEIHRLATDWMQGLSCSDIKMICRDALARPMHELAKSVFQQQYVCTSSSTTTSTNAVTKSEVVDATGADDNMMVTHSPTEIRQVDWSDFEVALARAKKRTGRKQEN